MHTLVWVARHYYTSRSLQRLAKTRWISSLDFHSSTTSGYQSLWKEETVKITGTFIIISISKPSHSRSVRRRTIAHLSLISNFPGILPAYCRVSNKSAKTSKHWRMISEKQASQRRCKLLVGHLEIVPLISYWSVTDQWRNLKLEISKLGFASNS